MRDVFLMVDKQTKNSRFITITFFFKKKESTITLKNLLKVPFTVDFEESNKFPFEFNLNI